MSEEKLVKEKNKYDEEPVHYCKRCLSIKILNLEELEVPYCKDCGGTSIEQANIFDWQDMYKEKYNKEFLKQ